MNLISHRPSKLQHPDLTEFVDKLLPILGWPIL